MSGVVFDEDRTSEVHVNPMDDDDPTGSYSAWRCSRCGHVEIHSDPQALRMAARAHVAMVHSG